MKTEKAAQAGNDGIVIMPDGTKYISSVQNGGVSRIRPGQPAELIASNIPNAASMCYDAGANQLVIPMNPNNGLRLRAARPSSRPPRPLQASSSAGRCLAASRMLSTRLG